jgi:PAS domain S-box-containing protein
MSVMNHTSEVPTLEMLQLLADSVRDHAVFYLDADGRVQTWTAAAERLAGWTADEIIDRHFSCLYPPDAISQSESAAALTAAATDGRYETQGSRVRKDGKRMWTRHVLTAFRGPDGTLLRFGSVMHDVTPQRQAEEKFRQFVESAPDAVVILNSTGEIVFVNSLTEKLFGYARSELLGQPVEMLVPGRFLPRHQNLREGYVTDPQTRAMGSGLNLYGKHKDGHEIPVEISLSPVQTDEGLLVSSSIRDISQRRQNEEKIRRQAQEIMDMAAVPVAQVWDGVLLVPLIGTLDSQRSQQLMERLLNKITETVSPIAVVDITGVPTIDTQTAQHLIETISAVRLLGAEVILTGVSPSIAQTLIHLGIDLSSVNTRSSLAKGLQLALNTLHLTVIAKAAHPKAHKSAAS